MSELTTLRASSTRFGSPKTVVDPIQTRHLESLCNSLAIAGSDSFNHPLAVSFVQERADAVCSIGDSAVELIESVHG
jgi:hypothetical protein